MDACYKAAQELYGRNRREEPCVQEDLRQLHGLHGRWLLWHQVADYTMDSYMIRYRNQKT